MEAQNMVGHMIRRLHQVSTQVFARHMQAEGLDLTPVQFAAMDAIATDPGIDQASVAALIGYDRATIGGVIDRLEHKGLVERRVSARDRRAREVRLTVSGEALFARILPIVTTLQGEILPGLDAEERANFFSLARKAVQASEESPNGG